jgi:hypothetical protein
MAGEVNQTIGHGQNPSPGLKDLDQLEEALGILLTLVHCLVVKGAWWQQAVSHHPLLLLQVLMTVGDVSLGRVKEKHASDTLMNTGWKLHNCPATLDCWLAASASRP